MLLGAVLTAVACLLLGLLLGRWFGISAWAFAALLWSLVVIALVTLIPAIVRPGDRPGRGPPDHLLVGHRRARRPTGSGSSPAASGC